MLSGADGFCDLTVLESLGDKLDDPPFPFVRNSLSVAFSSKHSCLRYRVVASLTRLIPLSIPKRWKRRLKCAFTVRRAILSCTAISVLSQPCSSNSAICRSRGPRRTGFSSMSSLPRGEMITNAAQGSFPQIPCCKRPSPSSQKGEHRALAGLQKFIAFTLPSGGDSLNHSLCRLSHIHNLGRNLTCF